MSPFFKLRQIHNENDLKKLVKMGKPFMAKINIYSVEAIGSVTTISNSKCTATGKLHTGRLHRNTNNMNQKLRPTAKRTRHSKRARQVPKHYAKRRQRSHLFQEADQKLQGQRYELIDILTDSLIRVIRIAL